MVHLDLRLQNKQKSKALYKDLDLGQKAGFIIISKHQYLSSRGKSYKSKSTFLQGGSSVVLRFEWEAVSIKLHLSTFLQLLTSQCWKCRKMSTQEMIFKRISLYQNVFRIYLILNATCFMYAWEMRNSWCYNLIYMWHYICGGG